MERKYVFTDGLFTARSGYTILAAVIVEALVILMIAGVLIWEQMHPMQLPPQQKVAVVTIPPTPPPPPPPPPKTPQPIIPTPPTPQPLSEVPPIPEQIPTPDAVPPMPPSPPPVVSPPQPRAPVVDVGAMQSAFEKLVRQAIQAQAIGHYPRRAFLAGTTGTVIVEFDYTNGVVSNVHILRSSGSRTLDRGAMAAVRAAHLPPKPGILATVNPFTIPIQYSLGG